MNTQELIDTLKTNTFFANLSPEQFQHLAAITRVVTVKAGVTIIAEGERADNFFVIHEGEAEVLKRDGTGKKHRLSYLESQDLFGEFALLGSIPRSATVRATKKTILLSISGTEFKKILTESQSLEQIFQNLSGKLSNKLKLTNEMTAQAFERELLQEKARVAMGRFLIYSILMLCFYAFILSAITKLMGMAIATSLISLPLMLVIIIITALAMRWVGFPKRFYGLTFHNWKISLYESLLVTIPILIIILLIKWFLIHFVPTYGHAQLFNPYHSIKHFSINISPLTLWILLVLLYSIHAPLQEIIVRGFLQSTLQEFLTGKHTTLSAILITNIIFSTFHLVHSDLLTIATFLPGLIWGWLYSRHKTLVGVCVSHILVGIWAAFIVGL